MSVNKSINAQAVPNFHQTKCGFSKGIDSIMLVVPDRLSRIARSARIKEQETKITGNTFICKPLTLEARLAITNPANKKTVNG